jgi:hypothetical protein
MQRLLDGEGSPTIATLDAVAAAMGLTVILKRAPPDRSQRPT